jgi:hypothetical protein
VVQCRRAAQGVQGEERMIAETQALENVARVAMDE